MKPGAVLARVVSVAGLVTAFAGLALLNVSDRLRSLAKSAAR